jgi:hypothetical protein
MGRRLQSELRVCVASMGTDLSDLGPAAVDIRPGCPCINCRG